MVRIFFSCFFLVPCQCVGPTTPFGSKDIVTPTAVDVWEADFLAFQENLPKDSTQTSHRISLASEYQIYHTKQNLTLTLENPLPIEQDFRFLAFHNGRNVTDNFLTSAQFHFSDDRKKILIVFPNLRIPARYDHDIQFYFRPNAQAPYAHSSFKQPQCPYESDKKLLHTGTFAVDPSEIAFIRRISRENNLNPNLLAALIAKESSFNPQAVSIAKAIGLTQITTVAETEVIPNFSGWPRHPLIPKTPAMLVKGLVLAGQINAENEWRLDPRRSIKGGIVYLESLRKFWKIPSYQAALEIIGHSERNIVKAILASYNSGAARVKRAIVEYETNWIDSPQLNAARQYVSYILSYCQSFSAPKEAA